MKRKSGYYWVRHKNQWFIGFYSHITKTWRIVNEIKKDSDLSEIIEERLIEPSSPVKE